MGFCVSYSEAVRLQTSVIQQTPLEFECHLLFQFSFDNVDLNTQTLEGYRSFHSMRVIKCLNTSSSATGNKNVERLQKIPTTSVVGKTG